MPSPVAHALAGSLVYQMWPYATRRHSRGLWASCTMLAVLPDVDFLPGLIAGEPWQFHPSPTHTLLAALVIGVGAAMALHPWRRVSVHTMLLLVAAYASHLLLDVFNVDHRMPLGLALLWPLSDIRFLSPVAVFPGLHTAADGAASAWLLSLVAPHNWGIVIREMAIFAPSLALMQLVVSRRVAFGESEPASDLG